MMVAIRKWMFFWLAEVKFSKAPRSLIDSTSMEHAEAGGFVQGTLSLLGRVSKEPVRTSGDELNAGGSTASRRQHPFRSPKKRLRAHSEEAVGNHKHDENPASTKPLSEERKAEIKQNLACHHEKLGVMKFRGEAMWTWFNILMQREEMLEQYSFEVGEECVSSILKKLKRVHLDINLVVQTRFRTWAGLGGTTFEPWEQEVIPQRRQKLVYEPTDYVKSKMKGHFQPQENSTFFPKNLETKPTVIGRPAKLQRLKEGETLTNGAKSQENTVADQVDSKRQLNQNDLEIIYDKLMENDFKDMSNILHSIRFRSWENKIWFKYWEEIRVIKLAFQKSIFQALHFMYKFELIRDSQFKFFFYKNETLDLIGNFLVDLLYVSKYETFNILAFIPDIEFLRKDCRTECLHEILGALEFSQRAHVLSSGFTMTVQLYQKFVIGMYDMEWSKFINELIFEENMLQILGKREAEVPLTSDSKSLKSLKELGNRLVNLFQDPVLNDSMPISLENYEAEDIKRFQISYIMIFYLLNFIKKYHSKYLQSLFEERDRLHYEIFNKQLEIFEQGFKILQTAQIGHMQMEIVYLKNEKRRTILEPSFSTQTHNSKGLYETISEEYWKLENNYKEFFKVEPKAENWFHGSNSITKTILKVFQNAAISWKDGIEQEAKRREEIHFLHRKNKKYQKFPNLEISSQDLLSSRQTFNTPSLELMVLWDPDGIFI